MIEVTVTSANGRLRTVKLRGLFDDQISLMRALVAACAPLRTECAGGYEYNITESTPENAACSGGYELRSEGPRRSVAWAFHTGHCITVRSDNYDLAFELYQMLLAGNAKYLEEFRTQESREIRARR